MSEASGKRKFFWGHSLRHAVASAAAYYGLDAESLAYREVDKRHGFVRLRRRVVIEVDPESPAKSPEEQVAAPRPAAPARERSAPAPPEARERPALRRSPPPQVEELAGLDPAERSRRAAELVLELAGLEMEAEVSARPEGGWAIELFGPDDEAVTDREGELLDALQGLVSRMVNRGTEESIPVAVDCGGFRERQNEALRELARETASRVRRSGEDELLEPLEPAERRIVHRTVSELPGVISKSQGSGYRKRVRIFLQDE